MSVAALITSLTEHIPDLICVPDAGTDGTGLLDVSNENLALTIDCVACLGSHNREEYHLYFEKTPIYCGSDRKYFSLDNTIRAVRVLFDQAEKDKLLMVAYVNGRPIFLPHKADYDRITRSIPFGNPTLHRYVVTYRDDMGGLDGYVYPGGYVRLGKHTIISVALEGV